MCDFGEALGPYEHLLAFHAGLPKNSVRTTNNPHFHLVFHVRNLETLKIDNWLRSKHLKSFLEGLFSAALEPYAAVHGILIEENPPEQKRPVRLDQTRYHMLLRGKGEEILKRNIYFYNFCEDEMVRLRRRLHAIERDLAIDLEKGENEPEPAPPSVEAHQDEPLVTDEVTPWGNNGPTI